MSNFGNIPYPSEHYRPDRGDRDRGDRDRGDRDLDRDRTFRTYSRDRDKRAADRSTDRRRGSSPPPRNSHHASNSITTRGEMALARRPPELSAPRSRERPEGEKDPYSDAIVLFKAMVALGVDQAISEMSKQELEKQARQNAIRGEKVAEDRFNEFPSAKELHRKERDRIEHDMKRVINDLGANDKEIEKHSKEIAKYIHEFMSRLGPQNVEHTAQQATLQAHSGLEALERKMAERFTTYDKKYKAQEDVLRDQSRLIASLRGQVESLQTQNKQIPILQSQVDSLKSEHESLQTQNKQIPILQSQVDSLNSEHERFRSADKSTRPIEAGTELQAIGAQIKEQHDKIENLRVCVENMDMDMVESAVKTAECDVPALKDRVSKQESATNLFQEQTQQSFRNFASQFSDLIEDAMAQTEKLEARIKSIEDSRGSLEEQIGVLEARVLPAKEPALEPATMAQTDTVIDSEARHTALDTARLRSQQPGEVDISEAKEQLATLRVLSENQRAYVATLAGELEATMTSLNELKTDHARQGVVLNGAQHAISNLSQQFNNLTTEEMLEKMYVHIVSLKSHENEGRRVQMIESRVKTLEDSLARQNALPGDTVNKKRKTGMVETVLNGHP